MPKAVRIRLVDAIAARRARRCGTCRRRPGRRPGRSPPRSRTVRSPERVALAVPAVEVAHDRHGRGVGRPDAERRAGDAARDARVRAELLVEPRVIALVEEKEVVGRQERLAVPDRSRAGRRLRDPLSCQGGPPVAGGSLPSRPRHSPRSAAIGSTRTARRAGSQAASAPAAARTARGGRERGQVARADAVEELLQEPRHRPTRRRGPRRGPRPPGRSPAARRARRSSRGRPPRAMRTPISLDRWATEYASSP